MRMEYVEIIGLSVSAYLMNLSIPFPCPCRVLDFPDAQTSLHRTSINSVLGP
jgi:hypothetical protein